MRHRQAPSSEKVLRDYGIAIFAAVLAALLIRGFVLEAYRIPSTAMKPTLEAGDTIFVAKWPFGLRVPGREEPLSAGRDARYGEVVVYTPPSDSERDYVKRVVGLPGDTVELRAGRLILNGKPTSEGASETKICGGESLPGGVRYEVCRELPLPPNYGPVTIPEKQFFLLGDLRTLGMESRRSTTWDLIPASALKARALWIWLSISPPVLGENVSWFSRIRYERMFKTIN